MREIAILELLDSWNFWTKQPEIGLPRKRYLQAIIPLFSTNQAIALTGVRRSGKSTLMMQLAQQLINSGVAPRNILIINWEDYRWENPSLKLLGQVYEIYRKKVSTGKLVYLFLDEIHKIVGWERFVRTVIDQKEAKIVLSGSSAQLLSRELGSLLTGRHVAIPVFPLSFEELLEFKGLSIRDELELVGKKRAVQQCIDESMTYGFLPEVVLSAEAAAKQKTLVDYIEAIITRDVVERHKIKEKEKLRSLARFYLTNPCSPISFNKIKEMLALPLHTVERFSYYLEEAYLLLFLKRFSYKVREQEKSPRKVYSIDPGLLQAYSFKFMENTGTLMENLVFLELMKDGKEVYYWKNPQQEEVDFVVKEGLKVKQLLQVCYRLDSPDTKKREIRALLKAMKEFNLQEGSVITSDYEDEEQNQGKTIRYIPLWRWLWRKEGRIIGAVE